MKNKTVVIWSDGFPFKYSASNEKNFLLAKALIPCGFDVILTTKSMHKSEPQEGIYEGVRYINFFKHHSPFKSYNYLRACFSEIIYLIKLKSEAPNLFLFASYTIFPLYVFYSIILKLFRIKLVLNIMEWHIAVFKNASINKRINAYLFDNFVILISSGAIVISDFIQKKFSAKKDSNKLLLIPSIADYDKINLITKKPDFIGNYILYCGGIGYLETIELIINAFELCAHKIEPDLILVIHGNKSQIQNLKLKTLEKAYSKRIHIIEDLTHEILYSYYKNADLLLVPLRNNDQDRARYPQKIAEYAASGRPIISNAVGQIAIDFTNNKNIIFAKEFSKESYKESIIETLNNPELTKTISENIKLKGKNYFNCYQYSKPISNFLNQL